MTGPRPDPGLDPRIDAFRADLAAAELRGRVAAGRYVEGEIRHTVAGILPMRQRPERGATQVTELHYGEPFRVLDEQAGWCWGQSGVDRYVGYVEAAGLGFGAEPPTHKVAVPIAFLFPVPDLKAPPLDVLPLGARLRVVAEEDSYGRLATGGWVSLRVLTAPDAVAPDIAATAMRLLGAPYLWGGRTARGVDCSGLVQLALAEAGIPALRDTGMQATTVGAALPPDAPLRRGDLVFLPGHVGLMIDGEQLVHANATTMCVTVEPLAAVLARDEATGGRGISGVRRIGG